MMNQPVNTLGDIVRITRKSKNLSQEALAERIGVCKRTIIDIGRSIMSKLIDKKSVVSDTIHGQIAISSFEKDIIAGSITCSPL